MKTKVIKLVKEKVVIIQGANQELIAWLVYKGLPPEYQAGAFPKPKTQKLFLEKLFFFLFFI